MLAAADEICAAQEHERQGASSQQDASDSLSMHSPGPSEASVARSGRGSAPLEEEPAMISFEDDVGPVTGSRGVAGAPSTLPARTSGSALAGQARGRQHMHSSCLPDITC